MTNVHFYYCYGVLDMQVSETVRSHGLMMTGYRPGLERGGAA